MRVCILRICAAKCIFAAQGQAAAAAAEFQKYPPRISVEGPLASLTRLGLARAHVFQVDTAKARTAYRDFLALWKDADPDIPILKQAKAEYARLQ